MFMGSLAAVAAGGSLGALARYGVDVALERRLTSLFPWSTFVVNVTGCFLVGAFVAVLVDRHDTPHWVRLGLVVGFCGAYTTFSTFAQESLGLFDEGHGAVALSSIVASMTLGLLAVLAGQHLGRVL
jgi:CrcB protein